ncbi:MAG TPA: flagellar hook assembly protein FlgD [Bacillales bacterium]|nr:flagellar hook assembly protein FlgD [Bacillales bacterium]
MIDRTGESLYLSDLSRKPGEADRLLGKDDFLKMLIVQLKNQNPLKPMDDKAFISQMATFSSLEQMTNMNALLSGFLEQQNGNQLSNFAEWIGKQVTWKNEKDQEGKENVAESGIVESVSIKNGVVELHTQNGEVVDKSMIVSIGMPETSEGTA